MKIQTENVSGCLYIHLAGELDHHAAAPILREIEYELDRHLPRNCVLVFRSVTFMDSSGIALILRLYKRMAETGGKVYVEDPPMQAYKVMAAAGLNRIISIKQTERKMVR